MAIYVIATFNAKYIDHMYVLQQDQNHERIVCTIKAVEMFVSSPKNWNIIQLKELSKRAKKLYRELFNILAQLDLILIMKHLNSVLKEHQLSP